MSVAVSCASHSQDQQALEVSASGDTVRIPQTSTLFPKIATSALSLTPYVRTISSTGVVQPIPANYAEVSAPLPGRVLRSFVSIGQKVGAGTPLFEMSSSGGGEVVKNYLQSKAQLELEQKALERARDLHEHKVASQKELDEAETAYEAALGEYRLSEAAAKEYQINLSGVQVGQPLVVRSPISGQVLENDLVTGSFLKEDSSEGVVVADLSRVWVNVNIMESDAPYVRSLSRVQVRLMAQPDSLFDGEIRFVGGMLDPETRSVKTVVECANPTGLLMPNMYADVLLESKPVDALIIPKDAVLQSEKGRFVMRKLSEGTFLRTPVQVQSTSNGQCLILSGLSDGDEIITQGAHYLTDIK